MLYFCDLGRLSIEVTSEQHQKLKALAAIHGKSMKEFVLAKLFTTTSKDDRAAMAELETLLLSRIQLAKKEKASSNSSIQKITDNVLREGKR